MNTLRNMPLTVAFGTLSFGTLAFAPAAAEPSMRNGSISVAQVNQMLDQASRNRTAQQVLTAYLGGIGETAGVLVGLGNAACQRPLSLSAEEARRAISGQADAVAATPLIARDMLARAGCRRG